MKKAARIGEKESMAWKEKVSFANDCPCRLTEKPKVDYELGSPHFADTLELLLVDGVKGKINIGSKQYLTETREVYVIPPKIVHYTKFLPGSGHIYVFKISFELLERYLNTEQLFASYGHNLNQVPNCISESYQEIRDILLYQMSYDGKDLIRTISGLVQLFQIFNEAISANRSNSDSEKYEQKICEIMQWTKEHCMERITVEMAAEHAHYSKYYFCRFFKNKVGVTYLKYLQTLKIYRAMDMIREGKSTTECCYECGFSNLSYFVKLFHEVAGCTTNEFRKKTEKSMSDNRTS